MKGASRVLRPGVGDRVRGTLLGLVAGDKNGGPARMALRLAESLIVKNVYDRDDVIDRYLSWHKGPPLKLYIYIYIYFQFLEKSFDTGATFNSVFRAISTGKCQTVDEAAQLVRESAGCNAAHRCPPLAMAAFIPDALLPSVATKESTITHVNPLSVEATIVVSSLCRLLIWGESWANAKHAVLQQMKQANASRETLQVLAGNFRLSPGGYAPEVLGAAFHFMDKATDFDSALCPSLDFAGASNYCPVIVGALAGAHYGVQAINSKRHICSNYHFPKELRKRLKITAQCLASAWETNSTSQSLPPPPQDQSQSSLSPEDQSQSSPQEPSQSAQ
jgi:ADP-ribosyl-[dinitrogen reductase] hydrolase